MKFYETRTSETVTPLPTLKRRHHLGKKKKKGRGALSTVSLWSVTVSLQMTEKGLFVRMGFSVRDHFNQASIIEPLNSCNIKLAVTQLVTFSTWMRKQSESPRRKCPLESYCMGNEAFGVDLCSAKTGCLISLEFTNSTKMPLVDYSLCKIHLKGIQNKTGTHWTNVSSACQPDFSLTQDQIEENSCDCTQSFMLSVSCHFELVFFKCTLCKFSFARKKLEGLNRL